ncbi:unnamed protein product [Rhizoctonia solani]|uniref:Uncharacterized protein n=1 Tax=Rhizoctonia solani TaxID=456999 RepID=A0A8H3AWB6_9AGAM|nr:unnamed protein product [Rhizoctonia solani]
MKAFSFAGLLGLLGLARAAVLCNGPGAGQLSCLAVRIIDAPAHFTLLTTVDSIRDAKLLL